MGIIILVPVYIHKVLSIISMGRGNKYNPKYITVLCQIYFKFIENPKYITIGIYVEQTVRRATGSCAESMEEVPLSSPPARFIGRKKIMWF